MRAFKDSILELITETSTNLPPDVRAAIRAAKERENAGTRAALALSTISDNIRMAEENVSPICQDTGLPTFEIRVPVGANQIEMSRDIREAVAEATRRGILRPNSVDSLTGKNTGDNLGPGTPVIHYEQWEKDEIEVRLSSREADVKTKTSSTASPANWRVWAGQAGTWTASESAFCTASTKPRAGLQRRLYRRRHRRRSDDGLPAGQTAIVPPRG